MESMNELSDDFSERVSTRPRSVDVRPNSILGNFESVDKIVVYAFGAFDRYYICWQDKFGNYQQERHGLPKILDEWLFPSDGRTRDLATLQVSLGHHDEFFAFDKHERISHINTEFRDNAGSMGHASHMQTASIFHSSPDMRRKSHTFSHPGPSDDAQTMSAKRSSHSRKLRPRSIAIAGALSMRPWHERKKSQDIQPLILEKDGEFQARALNMRKASPERRPTYSDAGVQTDMAEPDALAAVFSLNDFADDPSGQTSRRPLRSHVSSISSLNSLLSQSSGSTENSTSSFSSISSTNSRNPVYMGAMQRYFRESQYRLGDALIRGPIISIGAH